MIATFFIGNTAVCYRIDSNEWFNEHNQKLNALMLTYSGIYEIAGMLLGVLCICESLDYLCKFCL